MRKLLYLFDSLAVTAALNPQALFSTSNDSSHDTCTSPIARLHYGNFQGRGSDGVDAFLGIPFAASPTGRHRFGPPQPPLAFEGIQDATQFGPACPQQKITMPPEVPFSIPGPASQSEDCLSINVFKPSMFDSDKKLPVLFYIYGGAFGLGFSGSFDGNPTVKRSIALDEPIIFVSANYRINAFGFLGGKEIYEAGIANAGLHDQIAALEWVQKYISKFGGDPKQVTVMGQSAGAMSIGAQMLVNDGKIGDLFSAAILQSGSPRSYPKTQDQQKWFDVLVDGANCNHSEDRLRCLQEAPWETILDSVNETPNVFSYESLNLAWRPSVDGKLMVRDPLLSLEQGKYAKVPIIAGNVEDEGTIFGFLTLNITTEAQFLHYVKTNSFVDITVTDDQLNAVASAYPADPKEGSPFHTGDADALTPQFKRIAAFQGDFSFQAPRRHFLSITSKTQPAYSYRYARGSSVLKIGAFHGSDIGYFFGMEPLADFIGVDSIIFFTNYKNPNAPKGSNSPLANVTWDKWSSSPEHPLFTFEDQAGSVTTTSDAYRKDAISLLNRLANQAVHQRDYGNN